MVGLFIVGMILCVIALPALFLSRHLWQAGPIPIKERFDRPAVIGTFSLLLGSALLLGILNIT